MNNNNDEFNWISEHSLLNKLDCNVFREPMENIKINYVYINDDLNINNVVTELYDFHNNNNIITKDELFYIIENKRKVGYLKYKLIDILLYNINIDNKNINKIIDSIDTSNNSFLRVLSLFNEIVLEPSICIFHSINSLYFIFKETNLIKTDINIKKTKRVRININPTEIIDKKRTTKKSSLGNQV